MAIQSGPLQRPLAVIMCRTLRTISPDATLLEAARLRCTVGEIMNALADVFGRYDGAAKW